jgi:hypothetical protein
LPNPTTRRLALNIPLIVLWVIAVAVAGLGYWLLQSGNAAQADFYNTQGSDYLQFLNLQTQSTLGGMLLTAGVIGVFIALATHARNRAAAVIAANAAALDLAGWEQVDEDEESDFVAAQPVEQPVAAPVPAPSTIADAEPASTEADTAASEAVEETESPEPTETTATSGPDETSTRA